MPTYDYRCPKCERVREFVIPMEMLHLVTMECADCNEDMVRQPSAPNFSIKGFNASNGYSSRN